MRFNRVLSFVLVSSIVSVTALAAGDSPAARHAAAQKYLKVVPVSELLDRTFEAMTRSGQLPAASATELKKSVNKGALETATSNALEHNFTAPEIDAMAGFYGSPMGHSIQAKFPKYLSELQPAIMQSITATIQAGKKK